MALNLTKLLRLVDSFGLDSCHWWASFQKSCNIFSLKAAWTLPTLCAEKIDLHHIHLFFYNTLTTQITMTTLKYTLLSDVSNSMKVGTLKAVLYKEEVEGFFLLLGVGTLLLLQFLLMYLPTPMVLPLAWLAFRGQKALLHHRTTV